MRVLVVDDDSGVLEVVRCALEMRGHEVIGAGTAGGALAAAAAGRFDIVLLDIGLPDRSGLTALGEVAAAAKAPIIVMTGHVDPDIERDAMMLGAKAVLAKPFDVTALAAGLAGYLE